MIPGHYAQAETTVAGTFTSATQAADNSQHASFGAGTSFSLIRVVPPDTATNTPTNTQTQTQTSGSSGTG
jgi:hypothetical protein